jgi:protein TonB
VLDDLLNAQAKTGRKALTVPLALAAHGALGAVLMLVPLTHPASLSGIPSSGLLSVPAPPPARGITLDISADSGQGVGSLTEPPAIDQEAMVPPAEIPTDIQFFDDGIVLPGLLQSRGGTSLGRGGGVAGLSDGVPAGIPGGSESGPPVPVPPPPPASPPASPDGPVRLSGGVAEGFLLSGPHPEYPVLARNARIEGVVVLEVVISVEGTIRPETVRIVSGHPVLGRSAALAVVEWRFEPYRVSGRPVEVITTITLTYRLE